MPDYDVLVIGRSCVDHIAVVDAYPRENGKAALRHRLIEGGGQGGTAAACIVRLGGNVCYVGRLGDDPVGRTCLQRLAAFDVDTRRVSIIPGGRTPEAYIYVTATTGDRTIFYEPNTLPRLEAKDLPRDLIASAPVLLLDPDTTYLAEMLEGGKPPLIVYDAERWREGMDAMMLRADYFIPCRDFLEDPRLGIAGRSLDEQMGRLKERLAGRLIVTDGRQGVYYFKDDTLLHLPAPAVSVRDTIGAGDNFHAAFALATSRGADLPEAVRLAVAVASLSCQAYGGRRGVPSMENARALAATLAPRPFSAMNPSSGP